MIKDKEYKAFEVVGAAEAFTARVAVNFPEGFAQTVARWYPDGLDEIIEALEEERRKAEC